MATRADVVAEARRWIGTPFVHQQRQRGVGCDCVGLVAGVAIALGLLPADWWAREAAPEFGGYGRMPARGLLERGCARWMRQLGAPQAAQPGDVLLMSYAAEPQHLAIVADYRGGATQSVVHALSVIGRVTEHRLAAAWRARVVAAYTLPGLVDAPPLAEREESPA